MAIDDDVRKMKERLGRERKHLQFDRGAREGDPPSPHHDVLLVPPAGVLDSDEYYRFPVVKTEPAPEAEPAEPGAQKGVYVDAPEVTDAYDHSHRKVLSFVHPDPAQPKTPGRGMAFGTLPVKAEPSATACGACYVIDAQNLAFRNAWTAEEWNTNAAIEELSPAPTADDPSFRVLIAGPRGKVFQLDVDLVERDAAGDVDDLWPAGATQKFRGGSLESVDLRYEMEIWSQLRNGAVAGRVLRQRGGSGQGKASEECIPLVNITSLMPEDAAREAPGIPGRPTHRNGGARRGSS